MRSALRLLVLCLLAICFYKGNHCLAQSADNHPFINTYGIEEYRAGPKNLGIGQDALGRMYFGNNYGLISYDGVRWEWFGIKEGVSVMSLHVENDSLIYVGSQGEFGFFSPDQTGRLMYTSLSDSLPAADQDFEEIFELVKTKNGILYYSHQGMFIWHNGKIRKIPRPDSMDVNAKRCRQRLYFIDENNGLAFYDGSEFHYSPNTEQLRSRRLACVVNLSKDQLLICTTQGEFYLYDGLSTRLWDFTSKYTVPKEVSVVKRLRSGLLFIGTLNDGIFIYNADKDIIQHLGTSEGLVGKTIHDVYEDYNNNLWVSHESGLSYLELGIPFNIVNESMGVNGKGLTAAILEDVLYLGTTSGLYSKSLKASEQFKLVPGSAGVVNHLYRMGNSLIVGHDLGVFKLQNGHLSLLFESNGVWKILPSTNNPEQLMVGHYNGISLLNMKNNEMLSHQMLSGFKESSRVMEFDNNGDLWVTHGFKGAFRLQLNDRLDSIVKVNLYNADDGFPSDYHVNVFRINNETIFTANTGMYRFDTVKNRFVPYEKFDHILDNDLHIREMEEDNTGNIYYWASEYSGILHRSSKGYTNEPNIFNKVLYKVDDGIIEYVALENGTLIMGANQGFIEYNITTDFTYSEPFKLILKQVDIYSNNDSTIFLYGAETTTNPEIKFSDNSLRFYCSSLLFQDNNQTEYRYYIENFDTDWGEWSMEYQKEYINLPEGDYVFRAVAKNIYNAMSNEIAYSFTILPPWYRSKTAYFVYVMAISMVLGVAFMSLNRKHRKEKELLEIQKSKELTEKDTELEKVSKRSQEQIMKLRNEKLRSEVNHKNKELASTTMHLIHKKEFLSQIKNKLLNFNKVSDNTEQSTFINKIVTEINRDISGDSDWNHFQMHFDRVHGDFANRLRETYPDLSPQETKIAAYLRMNLSTKEMTQLLHISVRGVEKGRYRLRKKLQLDSKDNLAEFMLKF